MQPRKTEFACSNSFSYNDRKKLTGVSLRTSSYATNSLNQYTGITRGEETPFVPAYDANGNQTLVKTATGLWNVVYDANNRPVSFTRAEGENTTVVECGYDYLGRRYMKKVTVNGTVTLRHRYLYRGYLQIACCDLTRAAHPCLWLITWDPTEAEATRPLALQKDGTWYCYGLDITKNVWELFGSSGYIRTAYDYTPYGSVTAEGNASQPVQWSSEVYDEALALVYYNYRHYNPMDGRWINRDPIAEQGGWNLYAFVGNSLNVDNLGLIPPYNGPTTGTTGYISDTQIGLINGGKTPEEAIDQTGMSAEEIITGLDIALGIVLNTLYNCKNKKNTEEDEKNCNKCCLTWMTLMVARAERSFVSWSIKCNKLKSPKIVGPCIAGCMGRKIYTVMRIKTRYDECIKGCKCEEIEKIN